MVQLLLSGCNGRMGHAVEAICAAEPELELTAGFDLLGADIRDFRYTPPPPNFRERPTLWWTSPVPRPFPLC